MNRRIFRLCLRSGGAVALALTALADGARAQDAYPNAPFREHPAELAQAAALERVEATAKAFLTPGATDADDDDEDAATEETSGEEEGEEDEGLVAGALPLFEASLAARDPALAEGLRAAVTEMLEAREEGADATPAAKEVLDLAGKARAALIPADLAANPPFKAAVMASLLLDEGGVAESYEEASEGETDGYLIGFAALDRARALWAEVKGGGVSAEGDAGLARLGELFPAAEVPGNLSPDPEEAEAPAHAVAAAAEGLARADLYPGRDLAAAAGVVEGLVEKGCGLMGSDANGGRELLAIAAAYDGQLLADPLSVMAPEAGEAIGAGFDALREGETPDCTALTKALGEAKAALRS